jgi:predicted Rdx family selenoprotein
VKAWIEAQGRGPVDIVPGKVGQFDIVVDGKTVYSRHATGRLPSGDDLKKLRL